MHLHVHLCAFVTISFDTSDKTSRRSPCSTFCVLTMKRRQRRYFRTLQLTHQMLSPLIRGVDRCFLQEEDAPLLSRTSVYSWRETFRTSANFIFASTPLSKLLEVLTCQVKRVRLLICTAHDTPLIFKCA